MNFKDMRISTKLISAFALILGVFTLSAVVVFFSLNTIDKAAEQNSNSNLNIQDVTAVLAILWNSRMGRAASPPLRTMTSSPAMRRMRRRLISGLNPSPLARRGPSSANERRV